MGEAPSTAGSDRRRVDAFTFLLHWALAVALAISLLTGLRIAADYADGVAGRLAGPLGPLLLEGPVIRWHVWSAWSLTFIAISYAAYLWRSRQAARVALGRSVWLRIRRARGRLWRSLPAWLAINVVIYNAAFVLVAVMALTGWLLYAGLSPGLSPYALATIHGLVAYALVAYVVVHVFAQVKAGTFWTIFKPRLDQGAAAGLAVVAASVTTTGAFFAQNAAYATLPVARVAEPPALDGDPGDPAWRRARAVTVRTTRGANLPGGIVPVEVAAVHDGERAYFRFRWPDSERSERHLPLVKVEGGWKVLQSEFEINDEDEYYEDKFAVALASTPKLASGTVHLGRDLIEGPHLPVTRGLHFTEDGSYVDMWHWKSVRTGAMQPGLMDDNHFGPPRPSEEPGVRYTGGYAQDPHDGGGYLLNWTKADPDKPLDQTLVVPKYLPANAGRPGDPPSDPGEEGATPNGWFLTADEAVPYDPALDDFPVGAVLPGVVIEGRFGGDRGDLTAGGDWRDGFWTLEVGRLLETGSKFDLPLAPGRDAYLWVAVFNHSQTRHSQHLRPLRLRLE